MRVYDGELLYWTRLCVVIALVVPLIGSEATLIRGVVTAPHTCGNGRMKFATTVIPRTTMGARRHAH